MSRLSLRLEDFVTIEDDAPTAAAPEPRPAIGGRLTVSVAEAARTVGCSPDTIYRALWAGELPGHQTKEPRGAWRIKPADLTVWATGRAA
ncbi:helix-turn-helix DNA binding domain protein [Gordonia phage Catfish]|uniref:Helix-turn-helix DNA binding domain protein n=1 Tax=Gordonia phage Catfish TaxID=2301538 RepID=A0A385D0M1_9CAUD|nr:helix-turn-helix DNA binding domain protein [Gordonia phage Catfish]AXQ51876.1 helix-turn-helix DNA-binding domain protein [Gordonia phage Catfish]